LTLFFAGLFKKAVLADGIAPMVTAIYGQASAGHAISLAYGWMAAVGFTLQIYFDFSGYSDMAIGIARLFGVRLPPNFNSPLRASSIIDFWLRWHMTLTRFLTAYLYNPLTLWLTRRRLQKGLKGIGGKNTTPSAFITLLMLPTVFTMCVSGLWHGAGYAFIFWGFLNGVFLTINHLWLLLSRSRWPRRADSAGIRDISGFVLTFVCAASAMVFFRSPTMVCAWNIIHGMAGLHGFALPANALQHAGSLAHSLQRIGLSVGPIDNNFFPMWEWILGLSALAFFAPNTQQVLANYEPALGFDRATAYKAGLRLRLSWSPSLPWAAALATIVAVGIIHVAGVSEFLYWQF